MLLQLNTPALAPITKHGYNMAVITRIDARSRRNNSLQIRDLEGNVLCVIEAVEGENPSANLRVHTSDSIEIVKSNGVVLRKK